MKASRIEVGKHYMARVSGNLVTVRVDGKRMTSSAKGRNRIVYDVTNLATGRKLVFRSAQKFRWEVAPTPVPTP